MTQRHWIQNQQTVLVTAVTYERVPFFVHSAYAREGIETLYRVQLLHPFFLYAFVFMPDHCHLLMNVREPESVSHIINVFKSGLVSNIGIPKLWQRRFHARAITSIDQAVHYIHANPVRRGLCSHVEAYPWSSACGRWDVSEWSAV